MSTKQIRTIHDFSRHKRPIELLCYCGYHTELPYGPVVRKFVAKGWPISLGLAAKYFRCTRCGSSPRMIGPMER